MAEFLEHKYEKFIFRVKTGYLYSQEEFWADIQGNAATMGLTDFLQKAKGDVAFLETVEPGVEVKRGQEIGKIETIKATFEHHLAGVRQDSGGQPGDGRQPVPDQP